jgi:hypothetical protein
MYRCQRDCDDEDDDDDEEERERESKLLRRWTTNERRGSKAMM